MLVILFLLALKERNCNEIFLKCVLVSHVIHDKFLYSAFFQQMLEWDKNYCICEKCSIFNLEELLINFESGKHVSI